ncbi:MAG TPA: sn-glycerol-3-phosphate ABC transporter ATP-binding protein UgpC [Mycobacteriales bacterium]|nr:sn-glycerol-3-phosphate ABC transporter ATP-binding protein UgpC [Mycobacteriales bacterium]
MADVTLKDVGKVYADGTRAVTGLNLDIADGEFLVLVGPSGCGKTTALRMVAGLEDISEGEVRIGDRVVNRVPSRDRDVAMVFQSYALYPHLKVRDNIAFGLQLRKLPKEEIDKRVAQAARVLGLEDYLDRKPRNLSGGQRQRVAMGRAIVREPQAFLMDEPLSNLDAKLRVQMRAEIARIQQGLGTTTIYVTHDQVEAMTLGHRVAVMRKGLLQQVASPQELYDHPVNLFVAGFIGSPAMNLLTGKVESIDGDEVTFSLGSQQLTAPAELLAHRPALRGYVGREVVVGIRPEDMEDAALVRGGAAEKVRLTSTVELVEAMGSEVLAHFSLDAPTVVTEDTKELASDVGEPAAVERAPHTVVVARFGPRTRARLGEQIETVVDAEHIHVFDPETGLSIFDTPTDGSAPAARVGAAPSGSAASSEKGTQ